MKKKLLTFSNRLLVVLVIILSLPQWAAAYDFMVGDLAYDYTTNSSGTSVYVAKANSYSNLTGAITIPASVTYSGKTYSVTGINQSAFSGCSGLTSVTIPNSVTSIGGAAFWSCSGLTSVTIPNSVTSIGDKAFYSCTSLKSLTIGNSVTSIGEEAFRKCRGLKRVTIPNSVTSISQRAFYGCDNITYLALCNAKTIGEAAFANCTAIKTLYVGGETLTNTTSEPTSVFANCEQILDTLIVDTNYFTSIKKYFKATNPYPDNWYLVFYQTSNLVIGESVTSIGANAFDDYTNVTNVIWKARNCPDFTSTASSQPFRGHTNITSFTIGNEVQHIPAYLCYGLTGINTLTVGNSVTSIGAKSFTNCNGLVSVKWNAISCPDFTATPFPSSPVSSITFGNNVQRIPAYLCRGFTGLTSLSIPNSVTTIGKSAFNGCSGLTSLSIGNSVVTISEYAFQSCSGLTSVSIPNSVTSIENYAFNSCKFTSLRMGTSATSISNNAFSSCNLLKSVTWDATACSDFTAAAFSSSPIETFTIGNSVHRIPAYICSGRTQLTGVTIPNSVTAIGQYSFNGCTSITDLTIPSSVTSIGNYAFQGCSGLSNVIIENGNLSIGNYAFKNGQALAYIKSQPVLPPSAYIDSFDGLTPSSITLEVPLAAVNAYSTHDVWKLFNIRPVSGSSQGTGGFPGTGSGTEADPYLIFNPVQLYSVRNFTGYEGVVFKLMQNVDMTQFLADNNPTQGWEPIGVQASPFKGVFYGENHTITGLSMNRTSNYNGLFGYTDGALINNLTIEGSAMTGGNYTGAVVGVAQSSYLTNVTANVNVGGKSYTGGFVGLSTQSTLTNCHHTGTVTATDSISGGFAGNFKGTLTNGSHHGNVNGKQQTGGFVGVSSGTISDIVCEGTVTGTQYTGGFAGQNAANVTNVTASGNVTGTNYTGGFAGRTVNSTVTSYTRTGDVVGSQYTGGFAGYNESDINTASHNGTVKGTTYIGGFAGYTKSSDIDGYEHDGNITSTSGNYVGGFAGYATGSTMTSNFVKGKITTNNAKYVGGFAGYVANCTVDDFQAQTGSINGNTYVGGFAGDVRGLTATSCYAIGDVTASSSSLVSGFIAYNYGALSLTKCGTVSNVTVGQTSGTSRVGGLVGHLSGTSTNNTISNCFAVGDIKTNGDRIGGIVGDATKAVSITNSYYSGSITGTNYLGGIVGYGSAVTMNNNYANGSINGFSTIGGIAGYLTGSSSIESSVAAQDAINAVNGTIGRVYGLIEGGSTVGTPGTNSANRGMATMSVVSQGLQVTVEDGEQHGTSLGKGLLKYKSSYQSHGWDFSTDWTILETESYPYKPAQCAPPVIQSTLTAGGTSITGKCANGSSVHVIIGNNTYEATVSGTNWSVTVPAMQAGATVKAYTTSSSAIQSYFVTAKVGYTGSGTEASPYLIYTADDLANINSYSYYKVMNDIDLTSWINANSPTTGWLPIGMSGGGTMRQLDGNGHTISGLWVNSSVDNAGLISSMENATIKDLAVVVATGKKVAGANDYVGIVVGKSIGSTFDNVTVQGDVQGRNYIASIAGYAQDGTFNNCTANGGSISSTGAYVGGITGYATDASFNLCEAKDITATSASSYLAGIAAYTQNATFIECKVDNADFSTSDGGHVGGIAGYSSNDSFEGCSVEGSSFVGTGDYAGGIAAGSQTNCTFDSCMVKNTTIGGASYVGGLTGQIANSLSGFKLKGITINATGDYVGGLVGKTTATVDNCSVDANITGGDYLGGITGHSNSSITLCQVMGNITTTKLTTCRAGGVVGYMTGDIANCFSTARTVGGQYAGGIAGYSFGKIDNCYSSGDLYATNFGGGIVGYLDGANAEVNHCFAINNKIDVSDQNGIAMRVIGGFKNGAPTPQFNNFALNSMVVSVNDVTQQIYDDLVHGMGLEMSALKSAATYTAQGWDFTDIWGIDEGNGYPFLLALVEEETPDFVLGDANGDGTVNVTDYVATASYILEQDPQPFVFAAADIDENGTINVTDLVGVAAIALTYQSNAPRHAHATGNIDSDVVMDAMMVSNNGECEIVVDLSNDADISALQMDINLPQGVKVADASLTARGTASHSVEVAQLGNGDYRLLAASQACKAFIGHEGALLHITLTSEPTDVVKLHGIQLATPDAMGYGHNDIMLSPVATGLSNANINTRIYAQGGEIIVETPVDGMVVVALPNGISMTHKVIAGRNVIKVPVNGIVIVKMNGNVAKLIL